MTSAAEQEKWLNRDTVHCHRFHARLTPGACLTYSSKKHEACQKCELISGGHEILVELKMEKSIHDRINRAAVKNSSSIEDEILIYIEACLDYYEIH